MADIVVSNKNNGNYATSGKVAFKLNGKTILGYTIEGGFGADVLINGYVIEFQHSPISRDEIKERNEFYTNCGYKVIWVFDANDKIKNTLCHRNRGEP